MPPPLVVVLTGPTGIGKSECAEQAAARLAGRLPVEIISVDSALVYRGMDIGTAKPSAALRARLPHHLIDIRDPAERYSAGEFVRDAEACIAAVHGRGHLPLLVGGTMLYLSALYGGLAVLPPASAQLRLQLDAQARVEGWPALHARLATVDPAAAARIAPQDAQRIQRALEVHGLTGVPLSEWQRATQGARDRFRWLRYALVAEEPAARAALRARLVTRLSRMLDEGLLDEVRGLHERGDLTAAHPSMRAVGYRQLWPLFDAGASPTAQQIAQARQRAEIATWQLAKRQLTWLRHEEGWNRWPAPALPRMEAAGAVGRAEVLAADILAAAHA